MPGRRSTARRRPASPASLVGARKAAFPGTLRPQLATLSKEVPEAGEWLYELKFDGYRILARIDGGRVRLVTRGGHDWTARMVPLARAIERLGLRSAWLDGEIVVQDERGVPRFNALQNAFDAARTDAIRYFLFDVPYLEGYDLRATPLRERRALLERLLASGADEALRFSEALPGDARALLRSACALGLEGIVAKRADAPYVPARTTTWRKLKCSEQQEFVIGGYTDRSGSAAEVGSLLLGFYREDGELVFAGAVGTGWNARTAAELKRKLHELEVPRSPFAADGPVRKGRWSSGRTRAVEHWVKPRLVAQVAFGEWTPDGLIRHASFQGLRTDKAAREVVRERPARPLVARTGGTPSRKARR